jgi:hypothetical protein
MATLSSVWIGYGCRVDESLWHSEVLMDWLCTYCGPGHVEFGHEVLMHSRLGNVFVRWHTRLAFRFQRGDGGLPISTTERGMCGGIADGTGARGRAVWYC